jgi:C_GCAxxG_C_C family probable redox protein
MAGGLAASGGPCGALIGALVLLGTLFGKDEPEKKDNPLMWKSCWEFRKRFEREVVEKWGSINCLDITGVDWKDRDQMKAFYQGEGAKQCSDNTAKAARILGEVLEKYTAENEK